MRHSLLKLCEQLGLLYIVEGNEVCILASEASPHVPHSIQISLTRDNRIGILVQFPQCEAKEIDNLDDFCRVLEDGFCSRAKIQFDQAGQHFFMYGVYSRYEFRECVRKLVQDCDTIRPLLEDVGKSGYCHPDGIVLARTAPSEFSAPMQ